MNFLNICTCIYKLDIVSEGCWNWCHKGDLTYQIYPAAVWQSHLLGKFVHCVCRVLSVNKMTTFNSYFLSVPLSSAGLIKRLVTEGRTLYSHRSFVILECLSTNVHQKYYYAFCHSVCQPFSRGRSTRSSVFCCDIFPSENLYISLYKIKISLKMHFLFLEQKVANSVMVIVLDALIQALESISFLFGEFSWASTVLMWSWFSW